MKTKISHSKSSVAAEVEIVLPSNIKEEPEDTDDDDELSAGDSVLYEWSNYEVGQLFETMKELQQKVANCLENQALVYQLIGKVNVLEEKFNQSRNVNTTKIKEAGSTSTEGKPFAFTFMPTKKTVKVSKSAAMKVKFNSCIRPVRKRKRMLSIRGRHQQEEEERERIETESVESLANFEEEDCELMSSVQAKMSDDEIWEPKFTNSDGESGKDHEQKVSRQSFMPTSVSDAILTSPGSSRKLAQKSCEMCEKLFTSGWHLKRHLLTIHSVGKPLQCPICKQLFRGPDRLRRHKNREHGYKPENVNVNPRTGRMEFGGSINDEASDEEGFGNESGSVIHLDRLSEKLDPLFRVTRLSEKSSSTTSTSYQNPKSCACNSCGRVLASPWHLKRHLLSVHKIGKPLKCIVCNLKFGGTDKLRRHQHREHGELMPIKLKVKTPNKEPTIKCPDCEQLFSTPFTVRRHMSRAHPNQNTKAFICAVCGLEFFTSVDYNKHKLAHCVDDSPTKRVKSSDDEVEVEVEVSTSHR